MRSTRPNKEGYFVFSAESTENYENAFDALVKEVRLAEDRFKLDFIGGPSWKMAEDHRGHFVATQAANLTAKDAKAKKGATDGK